MVGELPKAPQGTRGMVAPELLPGLNVMPDFPLNDEMIAAMRQMDRGASLSMMPAPPLSPAQEAVQREEKFVPGPAGAPDVRVLVYTPPGKPTALRGGYLHIHGGGYVMGWPEINDASNRAIVTDLGCVIVSVDYRLAPETVFPGARDDCYAALKWLHANAEALHVDPKRIALGGESAGGGHAAALALYARDRGDAPICFQLLDCPMLDDRTGTANDPHPCAGEFVWTPEKNRYGWGAMLGMTPGGPNTPDGASPARTADLTRLPPTFILVGALDLFLEESMDYARRLTRAGVPCEFYLIPGAFHGFQVAGGDAPQVQTTNRLRRDALARAFNL